MNYSYAYVLEKQFPTRKTTIVGNTYSGIEWVDGLPPISDGDIQAADAVLFQSDYLLKRQQAYMENGINALSKIEALWDKVINNDLTASTAIQQHINNINTQFPVPIVTKDV
jgi:hypothetical protein